MIACLNVFVENHIAFLKMFFWSSEPLEFVGSWQSFCNSRESMCFMCFQPEAPSPAEKNTKRCIGKKSIFFGERWCFFFFSFSFRSLNVQKLRVFWQNLAQFSDEGLFLNPMNLFYEHKYMVFLHIPFALNA